MVHDKFFFTSKDPFIPGCCMDFVGVVFKILDKSMTCAFGIQKEEMLLLYIQTKDLLGRS